MPPHQKTRQVRTYSSVRRANELPDGDEDRLAESLSPYAPLGPLPLHDSTKRIRQVTENVDKVVVPLLPVGPPGNPPLYPFFCYPLPLEQTDVYWDDEAQTVIGIGNAGQYISVYDIARDIHKALQSRIADVSLLMSAIADVRVFCPPKEAIAARDKKLRDIRRLYACSYSESLAEAVKREFKRAQRSLVLQLLRPYAELQAYYLHQAVRRQLNPDILSLVFGTTTFGQLIDAMHYYNLFYHSDFLEDLSRNTGLTGDYRLMIEAVLKRGKLPDEELPHELMESNAESLLELLKSKDGHGLAFLIGQRSQNQLADIIQIAHQREPLPPLINAFKSNCRELLLTLYRSSKVRDDDNKQLPIATFSHCIKTADELMIPAIALSAPWLTRVHRYLRQRHPEFDSKFRAKLPAQTVSLISSLFSCL